MVAAFIGGIGIAFLLILFFALEWFYPVVFELTPSGATPGKRVFGLRVVMDNGLPVTAAASLTRNLLRVADFLPFGYGFAIVSMLLRRDCKRLGDIAAGTIVVHEPRPVPRIELTEVAPVVPARTAGAAGSGGGHRARRARAQAHGRAARRAGRAGGDGVRRRGPVGTGCHAPRARRRAVGAGTTMMTPLRFEQPYQDEWTELEASLDRVLGRKAGKSRPRSPVSGARVAALYRRACEHLALARARSYPAYIVDRLERLTADAHQVIYQRRTSDSRASGRWWPSTFRPPSGRRRRTSPSRRRCSCCRRSSSACWSTGGRR